MSQHHRMQLHACKVSALRCVTILALQGQRRKLFRAPLVGVGGWYASLWPFAGPWKKAISSVIGSLSQRIRHQPGAGSSPYSYAVVRV